MQALVEKFDGIWGCLLYNFCSIMKCHYVGGSWKLELAYTNSSQLVGGSCNTTTPRTPAAMTRSIVETMILVYHQQEQEGQNNHGRKENRVLKNQTSLDFFVLRSSRGRASCVTGAGCIRIEYVLDVDGVDYYYYQYYYYYKYKNTCFLFAYIVALL